MPNQSVTNIANAIINKINSLISSHNSNSNAHQDIRNNIPSASSTVPSADTTSGSVGDGTTWARSNHTHPKSSLYAEASHTHSLDILRYGNDFNNGWESISLFTQDNDYKTVDMGGLITLDYSNNQQKAIYKTLREYEKSDNEIATIDDIDYTIDNYDFGLGDLAYLDDISGNITSGNIDGYVGTVALSNDYDDLDNKPTIPSNTSDLTNDSGFITTSSVPSASLTTPSADTTSGSVGTGTAWARSDHTHPKSSLYAESTHGHSDADITTLGFYGNLPQANYENPSQRQVNSAINSAMGGKEDNVNKVTSLSGLSTDTQYPSAKAVYDAIEDTFNLDILDCINENFTLLSLPQIILTYNESSFDGTSAYILSGYNEGAYVDWGDGTPIETYESTDTLEHSYSDSVREHIITIYGDILNLYNNSFENFIRMTSINIPSGVTSLGDYCFNGCTGLTSVVIPSSVTSLGNNCFNGCSSLTNVTIPSGVTSLGDNCFRYCVALTNVTIPSSVISLGNYCFSSCSSLTSVTIPNGVTSLGDNCFRYCGVLTNVTIPSSVTLLGNYCFSGCSSLTSVTIPSSVISLGNNCFNNCPSLTSVTIPNGVTSLGNNCFNSCSSLTSVTIPNGVRSLGTFCFNGCTGLTSVVIPSSVISLGGNCFSGCTNLVDYQLYWETPPVNWSSTRMPNNTDTYFTIPNGTTANYTAKGFPSDKLVERSE